MCGMLGIGIPFFNAFTACSKDSLNPTFSGKILIVGAGAAGLTAGYLLNQFGIEYEILEAAPTHGGRLKTNTTFVDFPIPLGAEWLHVSTDIFKEIVNSAAAQVSVNTIGYSSSESYGVWNNGALNISQVSGISDRKFVNSSWLDFLNEYIAPVALPQTRFTRKINAIDYSGETITATTDTGENFSADKILITVPLRILQDNDIAFSPGLPATKETALNEALMWPGLKVFLEFSEKFYPTFLEFANTDADRGEKLYYDAAYGQSSGRHVLGLFSVGTAADPYLALSDNNLLDYILNELDEVFSGQASQNYLQHIVQNWSNEPLTRGAYMQNFQDSATPRALFQPVANKIYFAGEAYSDLDDWGGAHVAARTAKKAVESMIT